MSLKYEVIRNEDHLCYGRHNKVHRNKGPALIWDDYHLLSWCQYGLWHRIDGPAEIQGGRAELYYLWGIKYTKEEYESKIRSKNNIQ